jgi:4-hydroxy-2-oxoheptanedioate aldolase
MTYPSFQAMEIVAQQGFELIFLECEHGAFSARDVEDSCILANALGMTVFARVPNIQASTILGFLDRGVQGFTGPHIRTREDAENLVAACRFAPRGKRSFYYSRPTNSELPADVTDYMARSNEEIWVNALLEDREAVGENLEEILAVEGLDSAGIGHIDLSQSMGHPGNWEHPEVAGAMEKAWEQIAAQGKAGWRDHIRLIGLTDIVREAAREFVSASAPA